MSAHLSSAVPGGLLDNLSSIDSASIKAVIKGTGPNDQGTSEIVQPASIRPVDLMAENVIGERNKVKLTEMLGYGNLEGDSIQGSYFQREDVCKACGVLHTRPELLDVINNCRSCFAILRETSVLSDQYKDKPQKDPLEIMFASYGDPEDEFCSANVTNGCRERCQLISRGKNDRIGFRVTEDLAKVLKVKDPAPGKEKQLRMRYRCNNLFATLVLDTTKQNQIFEPFLLITPQGNDKTKYLRIFKAQYGHPKGSDSTGRMSYDVTEIVQGLCDLQGGSFLSISAQYSVKRLFRDPCPAYPKDLRIKYEVCGRTGSVTYNELRGYLRKKVLIQTSPTVAPLIFVVSATYGITPTGRRDRLNFINRQLREIESIEHKKRQGLIISGDEVIIIKKKKRWLDEKTAFQNAPTKFLDITEKLQRHADLGITVFRLDKDIVDCNMMFGNTHPGLPKLLEISLDIQGHDSERWTSSEEMQDTGFPRNFITNQKGRFLILVTDDKNGKGILETTLDFRTNYSAPIIQISKATYGELQYPSRTCDVTAEIQSKVVGRILTIDTDVSLVKLFQKDPSPGKRKQLKINFLTRGFIGNLRVREKNDFLVAAVKIGYPPVPPHEDNDIILG